MAYRNLDSTSASNTMLNVLIANHSDGEAEDLDLEGVLGGIFSGYTSLSHCGCEHRSEMCHTV